MESSNLSSNWKKLQASLLKTETAKRPSGNVLKRKRGAYSGSSIGKDRHPIKRRAINRTRMSETTNTTPSLVSGKYGVAIPKIPTAQNHINAGLSSNVEIGKYVAIDCEMVGVGPEPDRESVLARVSIVNYNGEQIYDSFVKPKEEITDYRAHVSGITEAHIRIARSLEEVQKEVATIIKEKIVVGHAVRHDFEVLLLDHPKRDIRDTARHAPYRRFAGGGSPKLKILTSELLGLEIQVGEHSSIEDARATMMLFRRDKDAFEREHAKKWSVTRMRRPVRVVVQRSPDDESAPHNDKAKKKKKKKRKR